MNKKALLDCGIDYYAGVRRFMKDTALYESMLAEFLNDQSFAQSAQALEEGNYKQLFEQSHALKGISGTLDMPRLYSASSQLTEYLRNNQSPDKGQAVIMFEAVRIAYECVKRGIEQAMA